MIAIVLLNPVGTHHQAVLGLLNRALSAHDVLPDMDVSLVDHLDQARRAIQRVRDVCRLYHESLSLLLIVGAMEEDDASWRRLVEEVYGLGSYGAKQAIVIVPQALHALMGIDGYAIPVVNPSSPESREYFYDLLDAFLEETDVWAARPSFC